MDHFVDLFPAVCLGCARPLPKVLDAGACRHQQLDLRDHRPHLTEFRRHELQCGHCGSLTRAAYDRGQIPASAFGPCLTAVVGLLTGAYHLSRRSAQKLLLELFGISISLGAISGMEARASEALKSSYAEAEREVQYADVKHTDATSWTRAGKLMSLWTLASVAATVYRIFADGCRDAIRPIFGPAGGIRSGRCRFAKFASRTSYENLWRFRSARVRQARSDASYSITRRWCSSIGTASKTGSSPEQSSSSGCIQFDVGFNTHSSAAKRRTSNGCRELVQIFSRTGHS